jgi:hypothetical protein
MQSVEESRTASRTAVEAGKERRLGADHVGAPATKFITATTCHELDKMHFKIFLGSSCLYISRNEHPLRRAKTLTLGFQENLVTYLAKP